MPMTRRAVDSGDDAPRRVRIVPRGLSKDEAATYCGCASLSAFDDWIRRGIIPGPIPGTHRWDRKAIDRALDAASNLATQLPSADIFDEWRARRNARAAQGG